MTGYLRYDLSVETIPEDEAETGRQLTDTMLSISEKTCADVGRALRSVHAKSHGLLRGELEVGALPPELAQGLFATPGRYPVVLRLSTIPGDILDDSVSTPRGLALKIIGVEGARLDGSAGAATQDFVLVDGKAFSAPEPKAFLKNLKLLAATTDRFEGLKKVVSAAMQGVQKLIVATTGSPSPTVATLGGQPATHILGETFYSQVPVRFGDHVAKISVAPVSPELVALTDAPLDEPGPDAIRAAVSAFFAAGGGEWEIRAQLCTDLESMPVEDASVVWPEERSPYRALGRIRVEPQTSWSEERSAEIDDAMAFSPWHGLAAHRPLGGIMRVRRAAYESSRRFRAERNGVSNDEPGAAAG